MDLSRFVAWLAETQGSIALHESLYLYTWIESVHVIGIALIVAAVNIWVFHRRVQRDRERWDREKVPPRGARVAAAISLAVWAGVVVAGRMIAYDWADCDRPQPAWINVLAQCPV